MLYYYNQEITFVELLSSLVSSKDNKFYILISDPQVYSEFHAIKLSPQTITNLGNFKLILIESWAELSEFITSISEKCTIVLYGIIKWFVEMGHNETDENIRFLKHDEFCAWELNKLFHKMFICHTQKDINIIVNDGIGKDEKNDPLIWNITLPNIRTRALQTTPEIKISLRAIFIKWFEVVNQFNDIKFK